MMNVKISFLYFSEAGLYAKTRLIYSTLTVKPQFEFKVEESTVFKCSDNILGK